MTMTTDAAPSVQDLLQAAGFGTLGTDPPPEAVEAVLRRLAMAVNGSDPVRRQVIRRAAVDALKDSGIAGAKLVDAALDGAGSSERTAGSEGQGGKLALQEPEPWPEPVDAAELLNDITDRVARHLATDEHVPEAVALWVLHAHAHDAFDVSPIIGITSPQKRCGKTTALHLIGGIVPKPLPASNITAAALFRVVEAVAPTLLVDEADTFLRDRDDLRGVLNSGHARASAYVVRTVGDDHEPRTFGTWAPKAIALIGQLPDTLEDRSIIIRMRRRAPDEQVVPLRLDRIRELDPLRRMAWRWTRDHEDALRQADPDTPDALHDRAADNWRPLLAIADAAGGDWPARARAAATALSGVAGDGDAPGIMVLADIKAMFATRSSDELASEDIVNHLAELEHRPWPEWRRGQPITQRALAQLLNPFDIEPARVYLPSGARKRGYTIDQFEDAWRRYVPRDGGNEVSQVSHEPHKSLAHNDLDPVDESKTNRPTEAERDTLSEDDKPLSDNDLQRNGTDGTGQEPPLGDAEGEEQEISDDLFGGGET